MSCFAPQAWALARCSATVYAKIRTKGKQTAQAQARKLIQERVYYKTQQNNFQQRQHARANELIFKGCRCVCVVLALLIFQSERNDRLDKGWLVCAFSPTIHFLNKMTSHLHLGSFMTSTHSVLFWIQPRETIKGWPLLLLTDCLRALRWCNNLFYYCMCVFWSVIAHRQLKRTV
jgi:hypothetical protein